ncbi:secretin receptor, putative [Babesia caballi]|uniref:Secretin receptor, putative n=1 Tax=Babesia caballi TaxID=5871 RepID=A0AAV4LN82_BABCB|nr:secretin receptor, putative [Babesia caballi]
MDKRLYFRYSNKYFNPDSSPAHSHGASGTRKRAVLHDLQPRSPLRHIRYGFDSVPSGTIVLSCRYPAVLEEKVKRTRAERNLLSHDDALADALDRVATAVNRRLEEVLVRLLERRKHQSRRAHLLDPEPVDPNHLTPESHDVAEQLHVALVNVNGVRVHALLNLADNHAARRLDAQHLGDLQHVVALDAARSHAGGANHLLQTVALHGNLVVEPRGVRLLLDDGTLDALAPGDHELQQAGNQRVLLEELLLAGHQVNAQLPPIDHVHALLAQLVLGDETAVQNHVPHLNRITKNKREAHLFSVNLQQQPSYEALVERHLEHHPGRGEYLLDVTANLPQRSLLDARLDRQRVVEVPIVQQRHLDDRRLDGAGGVDYLLNTGHPQGDVHGRHPGEVEGLERHLRARLADGLRPQSPDGLPRHANGSLVVLPAAAHELKHLPHREPVLALDHAQPVLRGTDATAVEIPADILVARLNLHSIRPLLQRADDRRAVVVPLPQLGVARPLVGELEVVLYRGGQHLLEQRGEEIDPR